MQSTHLQHLSLSTTELAIILSCLIAIRAIHQTLGRQLATAISYAWVLQISQTKENGSCIYSVSYTAAENVTQYGTNNKNHVINNEK